ncbi:MAG: HAD family hydrolase [Actinomycetota bacterium]
MITAVVFDWAGTLTPWHRVDLADQWRGLAQVLHPDDEDAADGLAARAKSFEDDVWHRARTDHSSGRLEHLIGHLGVGDHPRLEAALDAYHQWWDPHSWIDPQAPELLEALRDNGFKVGVLSNTIWSRARHEQVFERDGVLHLIDGAVYSSEIAVTKPHPEAFRAAARAVGAEPEQVAFVGDRPFEDVHGAQQAGMRAIFVPHSDIPLDQQVSVDATPDATVQQLSDVLDVVTGWNAGR